MELEVIKKVLDINKNVYLTPQEMAKNLVVTFYPTKNKNEKVKDFTENFKKALFDLGVKIVPYGDCIIELSLIERLKLKLPFYAKFGKKIKKGVAIIVEGESKTNDLAMKKLISLRSNPIITILEEPKKIDKNSSYLEHMNLSLNLFAFHMTNLVILVNDFEWLIYSLNGSHPYFSLKDKFKENILNNLIPKISAPVMPPSLNDFIIKENIFNVDDIFYNDFIRDLVLGGKMLEKTGLYPKKRNVSELNFRNNFYKIIGKKYLDNRNGMSYGFVARQLPTKLFNLIFKDDFNNQKEFDFSKDIIEKNNKIFIKFKLLEKEFFVQIPDVWVLTSKSGSDKSKLDKHKDIIKVGLCSGKMMIETPKGVNIKGDYKPSFDTRVILSHAVGNTILSSIIKQFRPDWFFHKMIEYSGCAIAHWHGYINDFSLLGKASFYGEKNPPVSCSSPQSAIYAFYDKINLGIQKIENNQEFDCEVNVEPHHGSNVIYKSIVELSQILLNKKISQLK